MHIRSRWKWHPWHHPVCSWFPPRNTAGPPSGPATTSEPTLVRHNCCWTAPDYTCPLVSCFLPDTPFDPAHLHTAKCNRSVPQTVNILEIMCYDKMSQLSIRNMWNKHLYEGKKQRKNEETKREKKKTEGKRNRQKRGSRITVWESFLQVNEAPIGDISRHSV